MNNWWMNSPGGEAPEPMTQGDAEEQIADSYLATPDLVADWLAKQCQTRGEIRVGYSTDVHQLDVAELLAAVMTGNDKQVVQAVHRLRHQFIRDHEVHINADARELWNSQFKEAV